MPKPCPAGYTRHRALALSVCLWMGLHTLPDTAAAGPLRDLLHARQQARLDQAEQDLDGQAFIDRTSRTLPEGVIRLADLAYGPTAAQRYDVYLPRPAAAGSPMPVLFMVHGGGWAHGDKAHAAVVDNKVRHWVPHGVVLVSVNYPLRPDTRQSSRREKWPAPLLPCKGALHPGVPTPPAWF